MTANFRRVAIAFAFRVVAGLSGIGLTRSAASLAFTSLLGLVPLATTVFVFVAQVPVFEEWLRSLEGFLLRFLLPGLGQAVVRTYIVGFAEQAAQLTTVSILLSGATAVLLMRQIEKEINLIFGADCRRPLWQRLAAYVFALTLGPVLFGASLWAATWVVVESVAKVPYAEAVVALVEGPMPLLIAIATLTWAYRALPARKVAWLHALAGGVVAGCGIEAMKAAFTWYVVVVPSYRLIYGALAILPLFMLWVYVLWIVVLIGAAIAAAFVPRRHVRA